MPSWWKPVCQSDPISRCHIGFILFYSTDNKRPLKAGTVMV